MKRLSAIVLVGIIILVLLAVFRFGGFGSDILKNFGGSGKWILPLVLIAALIDSINPCAFSVLLLTFALLFSIGATRPGMLKVGGSYILGIFTVYVLIGLSILQVLVVFNTPHFAAKIGALLLILFGAVSLINEFWPAFPIKLKIPQAAHLRIAKLMQKSSVPAALLLGVFVGLFEFPCTGGPYLVVLGLLHDQETYLRGLAYLFFYNLVFILPLVVILLIASDSAILEKVQRWRKEKMGHAKLWSGLAMVTLGVIIFLL